MRENTRIGVEVSECGLHVIESKIVMLRVSNVAQELEESFER